MSPRIIHIPLSSGDRKAQAKAQAKPGTRSWVGGPAMPSPGDPQAEPTIGKAINGGYELLEAKCNRCDRVSLVALRALTHPVTTPI